MSVLIRVRRQAAKSCANFTGKDGCLIEPDGSPLCTYFTDARHIGHRRCQWYERCVLVQDPALEAVYWAEVTGDGAPAAESIAKCRCGERFVRRSNRQKYCSRCAAKSKRDRSRESMRRRRQKSDANVGS